jgi:pre-mRNA cleavage complex 2 protein Pcf11
MHDQLRKLVEAGVSQHELRQILSQLRSLTRAPQAPPQTSQTPPPPSSYPPSTSTYSCSQQPSYARQFQSIYPSVPPPQPSGTFNYQSEPIKVEPVNLSALLSSAQANSPSSTAPAVPPSSITNLYNALLKAGVVSADTTPVGAGSNIDEDRTPPPSNNLSRDNTRAYRKAVLSEKIKLTTTDIVRYVVHRTGFLSLT